MCELGVGIRYGAVLQPSLKRRFGEHETDLAREIESFDRDISKVRTAVKRPHQRRHQARYRVWRHVTSGAEAAYRSEHQPVVHVIRHCETRSSTTAGRAGRGRTRTQCKSTQYTSVTAYNIIPAVARQEGQEEGESQEASCQVRN